MLIRFGYDITITCFQNTPVVTRMAVRDERRADLVENELIRLQPDLPSRPVTDSFGNRAISFVAPPGDTRITCDGLILDAGWPEPVAPGAGEVRIEELPDDVHQFLLPSRFCESDVLSDFAWSQFGGFAPGWARVQAVCDYVHRQIRFDYQNASATRTAVSAIKDQTGVCRDYAHTAVALCRALSIPARYVNGFLGDIGVPAGGPMDFSAWFEVFLDGRWYAFDARHNFPRIGRIPVAFGRDAADVPMIQTFGPHALKHFTVICAEEVQCIAAQ